MGLAKDEITKALQGQGCLGKSKDDEPVFVLCARDRTAPTCVQIWIDENASNLGHDHPKVVEAKELLDKMRAWAATNGSKMPD